MFFEIYFELFPYLWPSFSYIFLYKYLDNEVLEIWNFRFQTKRAQIIWAEK